MSTDEGGELQAILSDDGIDGGLRRTSANLDHGQPRTNAFHHPERFLNYDEDNDPV
ncbi:MULTISPECIES: hypothetical protein [Mycobacterium]|uniref:hypothetical protein n=1 Tax=Mycobacterium TaxID=1763 RepID=UPI0002ACDEF1|nr:MULTISPECIES: hypothetical protein [Mycobacterium]ARR78321.1 hypothetical protein MOTT12_02657 [Mycobacterium intracellulare subsp. yongonense]ARR83408.1 hypothetical protein MOTT27_02587 [Mycobacterium intracellulare subsp. yongonense]ELR85387.1 hypothetical protein W7U_09160 [Mycobacterium sp. H4Y]KEF95704.1 hypothetical protein K883_04449 [Mycobacterium sp. TKK-01-0059]